MNLTDTIEQKKIADTAHDIHPLIAARWSPRVFSGRQLEEGHIQQLLEAMRWSASSMNEQPWRIIYAFRGTSSYEKIFDCLSDFNRKWVKHAPVLFLTAYREQFSSGKDNFHALHDLGLALGNMSLQAQSMGIALHHMAGVDWKKAQDVFQVPDGYHVTTAIAIGFYGGDIEQLEADLRESERQTRRRKPITSFAARGQWPAE